MDSDIAFGKNIGLPHVLNFDCFDKDKPILHSLSTVKPSLMTALSCHL